MDMREVPCAEWQPFLNQFSHAHEGQAADIASADPGTPMHLQARGLPLMGITMEGPTDDACIEIMAASADGTMLDHRIDHARRIRLREWNQGVSAEIEIIGAGAVMTRLRVGPVETDLPGGIVLDGI